MTCWRGMQNLELEGLQIVLTRRNASFWTSWGTCGQTSFNLFLISSVSWYVRHYIAHHESMLTARVRRNGLSMSLTCRILPGARLVRSLSFPYMPPVYTVTKMSRRFTTTSSLHIHLPLVSSPTGHLCGRTPTASGGFLRYLNPQRLA